MSDLRRRLASDDPCGWYVCHDTGERRHWSDLEYDPGPCTISRTLLALDGTPTLERHIRPDTGPGIIREYPGVDPAP